MLPKTQNIAQCLQATNQFVAARINQYSVFGEIAKELGKIATSLNIGKLTIDIFSLYPIPAQGLYNFFNTRQTLPQFYQFKLSNFPTQVQQAQSNLSPALILQANRASGQQPTRYNLSPNQNIIIGRDPQYHNDPTIFQIALPMYGKVSGRHAEIQPVVNPGFGSTTWQIRDLNSKNGTYINGERLQGHKTLQPGDRITLAYPSPGEKSPEFVFDCQTNSAVNNNQFGQTIDSDLVSLVICPQNIFTENEKQFIDKISKTQTLGLIIIADISGANAEAVPQINHNLAAIDNWIKLQYPSLAKKTEIATLALHPFYPGAATSSIEPTIQQQLDKFCEPLAILGKNQTENILTNRLTVQLLSQINLIEQVINAQEQDLKTEVQRMEEKLKGRSIDDLREQVRKAFKKVGEYREEFLRETRIKFSRSKDDLINGFTQNSLMYKIKLFIDNLNPVPIKEGGQIQLQLRAGNKDTHTAILQFCQAELTKWTTEEWGRICNNYGNSGLHGLIQRSYATLNCIPSLTIVNSFSQPVQQIDIQRSLQDSFIEMPSSTSYHETPGGNGLGGGAARIGMQAAVAAGIAFINPVSAILMGSGVASSLVSLAGSALSLPQLQKYQLEQVTASLRQNGCNYYQSITRYIVEKLVQDISLALESEERRFLRSLETMDEQIIAHFTELTNCISGYKVSYNKLLQEKAELEQIKRFGSQIPLN